ncbi:MAG: hypothetical protein M3Q56_11710, partial [Bacteroidota bacterium]|nr:hypothetical protein [Bacteroidota bacterium]
MIKKFLVIIPCLFLFTVSLVAQSFQQYQESIKKELDQENYYAALLLIKKALEYEIETDTLRYMAAKSAQNLNAYEQAELYYKLLLGTEFENNHPDINFEIAEILYSSGKYSDAINYYTKYVQFGTDEKLVGLSNLRIEHAKWAKVNYKTKDPLIKTKRLEGTINTEANEFSPVIRNSHIYLTAARWTEKTKRVFPKKTVGRILKFDAISFEPIDTTEFSGMEDKNIAHPSFSADGMRMYFSICNYKEGTTQLFCNIYYKKKLANSWSKEIKLPSEVNAPNSSSTQGFVSKDEETGFDRLYFVSNREGTKGETDIWTVLIDEAGQCTGAENIDAVNTAENEYAPFYNTKSKTLYFSSNGHPGLGGQDVFKYVYSGKDSLKVINLGASVNTSYDDLYFVNNDSERVSYLASNRPSSQYIDENLKACCFDIYKVSFNPVILDLVVNTLDSYDSTELMGTTL